MVVLGAIATLLDDKTLLDAALSEILSMPPHERRQLDHLRNVDALLLRHHLMKARHWFLANSHTMAHSLTLRFTQGSLTQAIELARQAVSLDPQSDGSRIQLCRLLLQQSDPPAALESLGADSGDLPTLSTQLKLRSLAQLAKDPGNAGDSALKMQEAIFLVPWDAENWLGLAYVETKLSRPG